MRFNLIYLTNEENDDSFEHFIIDDDNFSRTHINEKEVKIDDLAFFLEQSPIFHYKDNTQNFIDPQTNQPKENTIDIFFDSNSQSEKLAYYDPNDGIIYLSTGLLTQRNFLGDFQTDLRTQLTENELINYAFLHELGHAIQHQHILENSKIFHDDSQFSLNEQIINNLCDKHKILKIRLNDDFSEKLTYTIFEGYADLYACTVLKENLPEERFNLVLNQIIDSRESTNSTSNYNTFNSLKQFRDDIQNGTYDSSKFTNFNEVNNYIEKTVMNTAVNSLEQDLINNNFVNSAHSKKYLPFLGEVKEIAIEGKINTNITKNSSPKDVLNAIGGNGQNFENQLNTYIKNQVALREFKSKNSGLSKDELHTKITQEVNNEINQSFGSNYSNNTSHHFKKSLKRNNLSL